MGASLPSTCQVGQLFFSTAAIAGANLYACTATNVWTLESASGSAAWSGITAPGGNLAVSMGLYTSLFSFGSSTGSNDLFKWTDSAHNTGSGALGHFTTALGSSAIPWQADANGIGWRVNAGGQLQGISSSSAAAIAFPQGSTPASFPVNSFAFYAPSSISTSYQWMFPSSDAAGAIVSDGNGTPGHLSILGFSGTGNLIRAMSPTLTFPTLVAPVIGGAENWLFTVGAGGVTANTLCKTDANFNIVAVSISDTGAYGICPTTAASGTTNYAVARYGQQTILVDGNATIGDLAVMSTTNAGYVHDSGQTASGNIPIAQRIIGVFKTAATTSGQTATVDLTPAHFGTQVSGATAAAWSGITAPAGNLSISMGSYSSLFSFGSSTGSSDMFEWTDGAGNSGTGALGHFTTALGSSAAPWQADANGVGWKVNSSGQLQGIGSSSAGMIAFPQGSAPTSFPATSFAFYTPATIATSYQWMFPSADAAGAIVSDGNGTPGHLSILGFSGTGNIARVASPTFTGTTTISALNVTGSCTGCGGTFAVQQGGTAQGTASTLNCGTNVTCSVNSGVATITASATAATSFAALTSATNTQAAMIIGTGASFAPSGSGSVEATSVVDGNQNSVLLAGGSSSAVDQVTITNAGAGGTVDIAATGTDQNIPLTIQGKGTGQLNLNSASAHVDNAGNLTVTSCSGCGAGSASNQAVFAGGFGGALAASSTQYGPPSGMMKNATESSVQQPNPATGTLKQLLVCISAAQSSTGNLVVTLRKGAVATSLNVVIAASSAGGCYSDTSDTVSSIQGDLLSLQVVNSANVATGNLSWSLIEQ